MTTNYLFLESVIKERLETLEGLQVFMTLDQLDTAKTMATGPAAVIIFKGDQVTGTSNSKNADYLIINAFWSVSYLRPTAVKEYSPIDGEMIFKIVKALNTLQTPEYSFKFTGTDPSWERVEGINEVVLNFECRHQLNFK